MTILAAAPLTLAQGLIILNVAVGVFLVGALVAAVRERRRQPVVAPNQVPYHHDEVLEGARLERINAWTLGAAAVVALSLPAYWLIEPARQDRMDEQFLSNSVGHGSALYATNDADENPDGLGCADCHGPDGSGGFATQIIPIPIDDAEVAEGAVESDDRICRLNPENEEELICQVAWRAPALNDIFLRFSREEIVEVIVYGRPGTPMPAWGVEGGGAKNEQSVSNIVDFLESIQIDADEARQRAAGETDGRVLFQDYCARCHTQHWSYVGTFANNDAFDLIGVPGGGAFGPNLTGDVTRQFPDIQSHIDFVLDGSDYQQPYGTRGIGSGRMPGFGRMLTEDQVRAIVEYERGLREDRVRLDDLVAGRETEAGAPVTDPEGEGPDDTQPQSGQPEDEIPAREEQE